MLKIANGSSVCQTRKVIDRDLSMPQSKILNWLLWGGVPIAIMLFIALRQSSESTPQTLVPFNLSETENKIHYVTVNSLNCRSDSKVTADVVIKLRRNQEVKVFVDSGEWSKIATPHECWVVTKYLSDKPNPQGLSKGSSPLRLIDGAMSGSLHLVTQFSAKISEAIKLKLVRVEKSQIVQLNHIQNHVIKSCV
jgi:hypothetical protein